MAGVRVNRDFQVIIDIPQHTWLGPRSVQSQLDDAREIEEMARKLFDHAEVRIAYETDVMCSHSEYKRGFETLYSHLYEVDEDGLPICCEEAQQEYLQQHNTTNEGSHDG